MDTKPGECLWFVILQAERARNARDFISDITFDVMLDAHRRVPPQASLARPVVVVAPGVIATWRGAGPLA